jgi:hypothetical protein
MNGYSNIPNPDPYEPQFKFYDVNKPFKAESGSMEPISTTAAIAYGLNSLSNWLTGRAERKQRENELEEQRKRWLEELRRQRTVARRARPIFEELKGMSWGDFGSKE